MIGRRGGGGTTFFFRRRFGFRHGGNSSSAGCKSARCRVRRGGAVFDAFEVVEAAPAAPLDTPAQRTSAAHVPIFQSTAEIESHSLHGYSSVACDRFSRVLAIL